MGVLGNFDHERFCQIAHTRIWGGDTRAVAITVAYREAIYRGENPEDKKIAPDARRLANRKDVKSRMSELAARAAQLSEIDAGWVMVQLKSLAECNLDDFLTPSTVPGEPRFVDISRATREQIGLLDEIAVEETVLAGDDETRSLAVRKTKIKRAERLQVLATMARIAGWEAPRKLAATDPSGDNHAPLSSFSLVNILTELDGSGRSLPANQGETERPRVEARQPLLDSR